MLLFSFISRWFYMILKDKVVVLTGASEGIGAACASLLQEKNAKVVLTARQPEPLERLAASSGLAIPGDLTDPEIRKQIVAAAIARFGRIDILINNAGVGLYQPAHMTSGEDARRLFELNFFAALDMIHLVTPYMKRQRSGTVVNVSSIAGIVPLPWFSLYSASKSALHTLSEGLRTELSRDGIRVISILPGYVQTKFQEHVIGTGRPPQLIGKARRWAIGPERCAADIVRGIERGQATVISPASGRVLAWAARLAPSVVERQMARIYFHEHAPEGGAAQ